MLALQSITKRPHLCDLLLPNYFIMKRFNSLKVIPLIPSLEEDLIQPEHDPNQPDNQKSNQYGDNQVRHASSAFVGGATAFYSYSLL